MDILGQNINSLEDSVAEHLNAGSSDDETFESVEADNQQDISADFTESQELHKIARHFPMLEAEHEVRLISAWQKDRDPKIAQELVQSHLRLIIKLALDFKGYGLPLNDLISEGSVGFMNALERFDIDKGFRLSTYAMWWIKANIRDYVLKTFSLVRMGTSRTQKKLFFNLRHKKNKILFNNDDVSYDEMIDQLSEDLEIDRKEVEDMEQRLSASDYSLDAPIGAAGEGTWSDWLTDERENQEDLLAQKDQVNLRRKILEYGLECLNERQKEIFMARRLLEPNSTLNTLAEKFNLSRERVRQIENEAYTKLKKAMHRKAIEYRLVSYPEI